MPRPIAISPITRRCWSNLSIEGFDELREAIVEAAKAQGNESDKIANIGAAYMRFVAQRPALARLMFGGQLPNRDQFPALGLKADAIGQEIGDALHDRRSAWRCGRRCMAWPCWCWRM